MTALAPIGGRRVILLLTDGMDTISRKTADNILERARQDELMILRRAVSDRASAPTSES
jgi:hypothetical protein